MDNFQEYGLRNRTVDIRRYIVLCLLIIVVIVTEVTAGRWLASYMGQQLLKAEGYPLAYYKAADKQIKVPIKKAGVKRIIYLSNSHARTGGYISNHLQGFLDKLEPGKYEVLDISDAGIFAPEFLQRGLLSNIFDPDVIILGSSYISFSDRMKLRLQSQTVRSFFKKDIFRKLSLGFWLRNYDIEIYTQTFVSKFLFLYRYRNQLRDFWEKPAKELIQKLTNDDLILFIQADEDSRWQFPDGYDRNLFQWDLYAIGRNNHMSDLKELADKTSIPFIVFNIPIHWDKSLYKHDESDYRLYQKQQAKILDNVTEYIDYQNKFPKEFTTYDALHPTWLGARMHALDLIYRLSRNNLLEKKYTIKQIANLISEDKEIYTKEYKNALDNPAYPLTLSFIRYDIFDPDNASFLVSRLRALEAGTNEENLFIDALSSRISYWMKSEFQYTDECAGKKKELYCFIITDEIESAKLLTSIFREKIAGLQREKLSSYPVPDMNNAVLHGHKQQIVEKNIELNYIHYILPDKNEVTVITDKNGKIIAYNIYNYQDNEYYQRVDILGDGSFILLQEDDKKLRLPTWVLFEKPVVPID